MDLPHYEPKNRPRMKSADRSAQFAPFTALSGHAGAAEETVRVTDWRMELAVDMVVRPDEKIQRLQERVLEQPEVVITYFLPDRRRKRGAYITDTGAVKKIDELELVIRLKGGTVIPIGAIIKIEEDIKGSRRQCFKTSFQKPGKAISAIGITQRGGNVYHKFFGVDQQLLK